MRENFDLAFFTLIHPIWVVDLGTEHQSFLAKILNLRMLIKKKVQGQHILAFFLHTENNLTVLELLI
jgi:hypothetical protein